MPPLPSRFRGPWLQQRKPQYMQPFGKYLILAVEPRFVRFRGHPKKNLELIILTRADCEIVNTG